MLKEEVGPDDIAEVVSAWTGIPAGHVPVDFKIITDDLDSNGTPTVQFTAGVLSGRFGENDDARTIGTEFANASTTGQAGGVLANPKFNGDLTLSSLEVFLEPDGAVLFQVIRNIDGDWREPARSELYKPSCVRL